jgi:hypothetical protein
MRSLEEAGLAIIVLILATGALANIHGIIA